MASSPRAVRLHVATDRYPKADAKGTSDAEVTFKGSTRSRRPDPIPVALADRAIEGPEDYGLLGSLSDDGLAEFLLLLRQE